MAQTRSLSVFALLVIAVGSSLGQLANLGDSFKFATDKTCGGEMQLAHGLKTNGRFPLVATLVGGVWTPEEDYKDRIEHHSPSVIFRKVTYNDEGMYEFTCGGNRIDGIQLKVVVPLYVDVTEGQNVTIPCYFFTAGVSIKKMRWTLNGSLVWEQDLSTGSGFERASVAPDWYRTGDLSLTVERVQLEDQGEYICHVMEEEEKRGSPGPVRLRVLKNDPHQNISSGPPKGCPTPGAPVESAIGPGTIISITLNVVLLTAGAIFLILRHRSCWQEPTGGTQHGQGTEEEGKSLKHPPSDPPKPNSNGEGCEQWLGMKMC